MLSVLAAAAVAAAASSRGGGGSSPYASTRTATVGTGAAAVAVVVLCRLQVAAAGAPLRQPKDGGRRQVSDVPPRDARVVASPSHSLEQLLLPRQYRSGGAASASMRYWGSCGSGTCACLIRGFFL